MILQSQLSRRYSSFIRSSFTFSHYPIVQNTRLPTMKEEKEKVWKEEKEKVQESKQRKQNRTINVKLTLEKAI